ncbi:hypothetical protein ES703_73333 [subsurface metagenome]
MRLAALLTPAKILLATIPYASSGLKRAIIWILQIHQEKSFVTAVTARTYGGNEAAQPFWCSRFALSPNNLMSNRDFSSGQEPPPTCIT